jgi:hypothetical protein
MEPEYFESIHTRLGANGGSDSSTEIAYGVGNAIFNTGSNHLEKTYAAKALRDFEALYGDRSPQDRSAADRMIDFLVTHGSSVQVGEGGFLTTLLGRLNDVLSLPA